MDPRAVPRDDWARAGGRSTAAAVAWRRSADWIALDDLFDDLAAANVAIARDRAIALLSDHRWATRMLRPLVAALAADPLFEPPLRVSRERGRIGGVLFDGPAARVTASVLSARALAAHPSPNIVVAGHITVTRYVRSGGVTIRRWRMAGGRVAEIAPLFPRDGDVAVHDGRDGAQMMIDARTDVVMLTATLRADAAPTMREFGIDDGSLRRTAGTDDAAARTAMLLTLLRVSGRADAPEVFDAATRDASAHARWSAMREWLALDAAAALPRLAAMALDDADAEVRTLALTTQAQVLTRRSSCPA